MNTDNCCVVGSNSCSACLEAEVARLREENSRAVVECDRLKEDNRKLAHDQSQLRDHTTKMTEELKSKFSKPLCLFWLPSVVWRNTASEQHVRFAVLKINAKKHLEAMIKDRDG